MKSLVKQALIGIVLFQSNILQAQSELIAHKTYVDQGWAKNSINTVIFRKNSLTSNDSVQFIAFYNPDGFMVLGKRTIGNDDWKTHATPYQGNVKDAHNTVSIELDGDGYLHVSWDHHNNELRYAKSIAPGSLELTDKLPMIGDQEKVVSYPEFYRFTNGDLLFLYRDGGSGNGNLVINRYAVKTQQWTRIQSNLIDGEGERNAYWQTTVDDIGTIHISWVWRESPDVSSNNDLCYAKSTDGGMSWTTTKGINYTLPITKSSAEVIKPIPQKSELINQTSMTTDHLGNPYIISYWKEQPSAIPQFQMVYFSDGEWHHENLALRISPFSLSGMGTKQIPISRPQILNDEKQVYVIFRDAERFNKVSIATNEFPFKNKWHVEDYTGEGYDAWEPSLDPWLWRNQQIISLFLQKTTQVDGEGLSDKTEAAVEVLDLKIPEK